jgi:hypothetical protein
VVPVSASTILLADARATALQDARELQGRGDVAEAFAGWVTGGALRDDSNFDVPAISARIIAHTGAQRTYGDVAVLGYAIANGATSGEIREALAGGVRWLVGRPVVAAGAPTGILTDEVAVLGIAVGVRALGSAELLASSRVWLETFVQTSLGLNGLPQWRRALFVAARTILASGKTPEPSRDPETVDVRIALAARGVLPSARLEESEEDLTRLLLDMRSALRDDREPLRSAIRLAALDWAFQAAPTVVPGRVDVPGVIGLLRRLPAALRLWTWEEKGRVRGMPPRVWAVDHEYHVQNILWLMLAPVFPDLRDEEYFPSIGQKRPRADLCIPSLRLIVEVKFIRERVGFANILEEVAADSALYFSEGSAYESMIVLLWDDSRRDQEHDVFIRGARQLPRVVDAVVVSRPGDWEPRDS